MPDMPPPCPDPEVAVVGGGPVGMTLAARLAQGGVRVTVLEREATPYALPRAAHLDADALRVLDLVGIGDAVRAHGRPIDGFDLADRHGRILLQARDPDGAGRLIHQPTVEALLRDRLAGLGVDFRQGWAVERLDDDEPGVTLHGTAPDGPFALRAGWVVGCDGAQSSIRDAMGSPFAPTVRGGFAQTWLVVDVRLRKPLALPDRLRQTADPRAPTTYVPFPGDRRRWEFRLPPGTDAEAALRPDAIRRRLADEVEPDGVEIERAAVYTFEARAAVGWRRRHVLLAGDAAHVMPPFLGQGLGAGLRDAWWLGRHLPGVVRGQTSAAGLDAYEAERRPQVVATTRVAVQIGRLVTLPAPLSAVRDAVLRGAARGLGRTVQVSRRLPSTPGLTPGP